ncbi:hypothetical protein I79_017719 [Cricetulus griseus]|uniref:Uncharacterized protein n=1 Tax=Cricetulus griseus TaxID=10029 RepID=G3I2S5_CRIGR|nr:hypothetical protein I79_017719 [Cricetulus griseus]
MWHSNSQGTTRLSDGSSGIYGKWCDALWRFADSSYLSYELDFQELEGVNFLARKLQGTSMGTVLNQQYLCSQNPPEEEISQLLSSKTTLVWDPSLWIHIWLEKGQN